MNGLLVKFRNVFGQVSILSVAVPIAACIVLAGTQLNLGAYYSLFVAAALIGAVLSAVHHAEVVAHKLGEPYGTLLLAVAITVIEVGLIISLMLTGVP